MNKTDAGMMADILQVIANDKNVIPYRPELNVLTGGNIVATILLQQIVYWWYKNGRQKFYKFRDKPKSQHRLYKDGDSWCEELGVSGKMFDTALKKIGFKTGKARNVIPKEEAFVWYYTDDERVTWYILNEELLRNRLNDIYRVIPERVNTHIIAKRGITIIPETTSEITTETTTENINICAFDNARDCNPNNPVNLEEQKIDHIAIKVSEEKPRSPFTSFTQQRRFDSFWVAYPKKRSKGQAERAWMKICPDEALFKEIMSGLEKAKISHDWVKDGGQFIPYPATWLNAKGWEDEHVPAAKDEHRKRTNRRDMPFEEYMADVCGEGWEDSVKLPWLKPKSGGDTT